MQSIYGNEYMPRRATTGSAGYDMYFDTKMIMNEEVREDADSYIFNPKHQYKIDTGIILDDGDIKTSEVIMLFPRSSLGFKHGMRWKNTVGIIDSDYRDPITISFTVDSDLILNNGDRMAQMIIVPFGLFANEIVPTAVRSGGLGSTGQ